MSAFFSRGEGATGGREGGGATRFRSCSRGKMPQDRLLDVSGMQDTRYTRYIEVASWRREGHHASSQPILAVDRMHIGPPVDIYI